MTALNDITGKKKQTKTTVKEGNPTNAEIEVGEPEPVQDQVEDPLGVMNGLG